MIRLNSGITITLSIDKKNTFVSELKELIKLKAERLGLSNLESHGTDCFRLIYRGKQLGHSKLSLGQPNYDQILDTYGISSDSTIHSVGQLRGD